MSPQARMPLTADAIDAYLEENQALIDAILAHQNRGNFRACVTYQLRLQQNLLYLGMDVDRKAVVRPLALRKEPATADGTVGDDSPRPPDGDGADVPNGVVNGGGGGDGGDR